MITNQCTAVVKHTDFSNKVTGYTIQFPTGNAKIYGIKELKQLIKNNDLSIDNLVLTKNNRLLDQRLYNQLGCMGLTKARHAFQSKAKMLGKNLVTVNGCSIKVDSLELIDVDKSLEVIEVPEVVKTIGEFAFTGCSSLKKVILHNGITLIKRGAFMGCLNLETISIPDSVLIMNPDMFVNCTNLISVKLPRQLTRIESRMFMGCLNLKYVEMPENVSAINDRAFEKCLSLESFYIPYSVLNVGDKLFLNCNNLKNIKIPAKLYWIANSIDNKTHKIKVHYY